MSGLEIYSSVYFRAVPGFAMTQPDTTRLGNEQSSNWVSNWGTITCTT